MFKQITDLTMVQAVRLPSFRRLFIGEGVAVFADQMLYVALTLLALRVGGTGLALGSVLAVAAVPGALLMPVGGWVSDKFSPARVLLLSGIGRALLASAFALVAVLEVSSYWPLYGLAAGLGILNALYFPASLSTVPVVLGDKTLLGAGNALVLGVQQASETAGPILAAATVALFGLGAAFGLNALMFVAAAVLFGWVVYGMRCATETAGEETAVPEGEREDTGRPFNAIVEGVRYAWRDPLLRTMLFALTVLSFSTSGPLRVGGAVIAETLLGGAEAFGVLLSAFGAGSLIGLTMAGSLVREGRRGLDLILGMATLGLGLAALGFVPNLWLAATLVAGMGISAGYLGVLLMAGLQEVSNPALRGRIISLMMFAAVAVDPISYALTGAFVEIDVRIVFTAAGALLVMTALLGATNRTIRNLQ